MNIVSLSLCYPSPKTPHAGAFVRRRLAALSETADVRVISPNPVPFITGLLTGRKAEIRREPGPPPAWHVPMPYLPGISRPLNPYLYARAVAPLLESWIPRGVDILDAHFIWPDGVATAVLARKLNIPFAVTLRGVLPRYSTHLLKRRSIIRTLKDAAVVFSVSDSLRDVAIRLGAPADRIHVIPNGLDADVFRPGDRRDARALLGISPDDTVLITVGHLCRRKGFHRVLNILPELIREMPRLRYLIVGADGAEGRFDRVLRKTVRGLGLDDRVTFTGHLPADRLALHLQAADLFILPTGNEGCCNALIEAVATGLPVVTTDVGDNRRIVQPVSHRLIRRDDRHEMVEAVRALHAETENTTFASAPPPSWASVGSETADVLAEAVSRTRTTHAAPLQPAAPV